MSRHLTAEELERYADGESEAQDAAAIEEHLPTCAACATAVLSHLQMKRAVRAAFSLAAPSDAIRARIAGQLRGTSRFCAASPRVAWWVAAAAILALAVTSGLLVGARGASAVRELADLHATTLASTSPLDVFSSDRHTVKPWFEGKVPFSVPVPSLESTPFRLIGGRVVYWRGRPGAYLLVSKGGHRISVFVFMAETVPARPTTTAVSGFNSVAWRTNGLQYVAIADIAHEDLERLKDAFAGSA